ncbi:MAG: hypothetical protein HPY62_12445 [Bacteroidales bacterium]|nr:hypothetical protein [Bacteroidales bacterium]
MKLSVIKILFAVTLLMPFPGCKKNYLLSEKQIVLFQFEYRGEQHSGFIIDNEGNVLVYSNPEGWNFPDTNMILTEEQVYENLEKCVFTGKKIPGEELRKYAVHIPNITMSKVTAARNTGAGIGTIRFLCYQYSESTETYKVSVIRTEGDYTSENLNFYSKKVIAWMRGINNNLTRD